MSPLEHPCACYRSTQEAEEYDAEAAEEEEDYDRREDDMAPDHGPIDNIDLDGGTNDRRS